MCVCVCVTVLDDDLCLPRRDGLVRHSTIQYIRDHPDECVMLMFLHFGMCKGNQLHPSLSASRDTLSNALISSGNDGMALEEYWTFWNCFRSF